MTNDNPNQYCNQAIKQCMWPIHVKHVLKKLRKIRTTKSKTNKQKQRAGEAKQTLESRQLEFYFGISANFGLFPHHFPIVDENVEDAFAVPRDLPVAALDQSILLLPLRLRSEIHIDSKLFTSFLITLVPMRKSLLSTAGPPASAT